MPVIHYMKSIVSFIVVFGFTFLHAVPSVHHFDVKAGMIMYAITGGGQLTPETNLTIEGHAMLRFRAWGNFKREEEKGLFFTSGAIKYSQNIHRLEKETKDKIITVDYANEQLLERKKGTTLSNTALETEGLVQRGQDVIVGHLCKIWIGPGIEKCIYKGIVLKQESHVMGISYIRVATEINFDIKVSAQKCTVPDYPVQEFGLYRENIKTKNEYKAENFCKILKDINHEIDVSLTSVSDAKLNNKQRIKFINHIGKNIYRKQKVFLSKLLVSIKEVRACLQTVENVFEVNECKKQYSQIKTLWDTKKEVDENVWDAKRKEKLLDQIEDELIDLQSRMPCIKRAKNFTDLSSCMK